MEATPRSRRKLVWVAAGVFPLLAVGILALLFRVCAVSGASMEPTYHAGDRLLVRRSVGEIARGDLLVFRNPLASSELLVKRVVGLPGETIEGRGDQLWIDGAALAEPYTKAGTGVGELLPCLVPGGHYYLVGDNRSESIDSRQFDAVDEVLVVGRVVWRVWPW